MTYFDQLPKPLLDDIVCGKCVPIIGSGFSKNAKLPNELSMPLWNDLGDYFSEILKFKFSNPIDAMSAYSHEYSKAKLIEDLWNCLHMDKVESGASHISFAGLPFNTIITTNFDNLIEQGFEKLGKRYHVIVDETQLSLSFTDNTTSSQIIPKLVKMHGDLNHPTNLVVTEEDYDTFLQKNPILSTYISNILITKTPLFIGYSLDDPDFRGIFKIISDRLGKLRRPAYIIKINPSKYDITKYQRRGVNVLGFMGKSIKYNDLYQNLFDDLKNYWEENVVKRSFFTNEDTLSEFLLPKDSPSRLCYFAIPFQLSSYYREHIYPIVSEFGFHPISSIDVIESGENLAAKTSSLIDRSAIIIADLTYLTESVVSEFNTAKIKNKPIILLTEEEKIESSNDVVFILKRSSIFDEPDQEYIEKLSIQLKKFQLPSSQSYEEPLRLLDKKEYKAALISAFILLEYELINYIKEKKEDSKRCTIGQAFKISLDFGIINEVELKKLKRIKNVRNILLHTRRKLSKKQATDYVNTIMSILDKIRFVK